MRARRKKHNAAKREAQPGCEGEKMRLISATTPLTRTLSAPLPPASRAPAR
jgi:hypothetical protein